MMRRPLWGSVTGAVVPIHTVILVTVRSSKTPGWLQPPGRSHYTASTHLQAYSNAGHTWTVNHK